MAEEYSIDVFGQPYFGCTGNRTYTVYFSEPEGGVTEETGICLLIAGFGGEACSGVYRKMRREFADRENLVVIQCNYMGYEFMAGDGSQQIETLMSMENFFTEEERSYIREDRLDAIQGNVRSQVFHLEETKDNFCEMGLFQAMDNVRAVKVVLDILALNGLDYNKKKIIAYGQSHGAYLCYLCNALYPDLFSFIIDNSAWTWPIYLTKASCCYRTVTGKKQDGPVLVCLGALEYQGLSWIDDFDAYHLSCVYQNVENKACILSFHSVEDALVPIEEKRNFLKSLENVVYHEIGQAELDGEVFKTAEHGMGADFLKLFFRAMSMGMAERKSEGNDLWGEELCARRFTSDKYDYFVRMAEDVPVLYREEKKTKGT